MSIAHCHLTYVTATTAVTSYHAQNLLWALGSVPKLDFLERESVNLAWYVAIDSECCFNGDSRVQPEGVVIKVPGPLDD
jgi:hypothetical protein